jgi:lysyl-tRNA synthetase class 2
MMTHCEEMISFAARELTGILALNFQGRRIDLEGPWDRISVTEAFERFGSFSMEDALSCDRFDEILGLEIEPCLGLEKPVFLYDYPARCGALARLKPGNFNLAERFELYISGIEICNAFSELIDPIEQRRRFENERALRAQMGKIDYPLSEKFLDALKFMPPAAGNALGLDRLAMLFADAPNIDR